MDKPNTRYLVKCETVQGIFGLFEDYEKAHRKAAEWTEDYGLAFVVQEHPARSPERDWEPKDKPEGWVNHLFRRLGGGKR